MHIIIFDLAEDVMTAQTTNNSTESNLVRIEEVILDQQNNIENILLEVEGSFQILTLIHWLQT
jgi:hypothetical protein